MSDASPTGYWGAIGGAVLGAIGVIATVVNRWLTRPDRAHKEMLDVLEASRKLREELVERVGDLEAQLAAALRRIDALESRNDELERLACVRARECSERLRVA